MPKPTARDRLKDARHRLYREAVLDAAERIFADAGYEATKVSEIAGEAGVSLATFYTVFKKKWEVYRAVHQRRLEEMMVVLAVRGTEKLDTLGVMIAGVEGYMAFHMKHPNYLRMHLRERVAWTSAEGLRSPEQTHAWNAGLTMIMTGFETGIKDGLFVDDDPELMARTMIGMQQVRLALWIERDQVDTPAEVTRGAMPQLVRSFCPTDRVVEFLATVELREQRESA